MESVNELLTTTDDYVKIGVIFLFYGLFGYAYAMRKKKSEEIVLVTNTAATPQKSATQK
jgi:hypothetical protein